MSNRTKFIEHLKLQYPEISPEMIESLVAENMISDFSIVLPIEVLTSLKKTVKSFHSLRTSKAYQDKMRARQEQLQIKDCGHFSVMMSFDFHLNAENKPKLIEINTNAAFHLLGIEMYQALKQQQSWSPFQRLNFKDMFEAEFRLSSGSSDRQLKNLLITDEVPEQQRLYLEFLAYKELFKSFGWQAEIVDTAQIQKTKPVDFIYNRNTDFYFQNSQTATLKELSFSGATCVSPHPYEYLLLADKERMIEWGKDQYLESCDIPDEDINHIRSALPQTVPLSSATKDELWVARKNLFFKPMRAFGSKQSYKGASMSRKAFESLIDQETLAQEYINAPTVTFETASGPQEFKFDLRCYTYQDEIQSIVARIYQGQVTNLKTPHGGFAPVIFN
ncbi:MAG: hypothetical protein ACLGGX_06685 [Bdellovibrionia bacterium]